MSEKPACHSDLFDLKDNPGVGMCKVKYCRNCVGNKKGGLCNKHHQQWFKARHPRKCAYHILKGSAKRRGLDFSLTYDYYCGITDGAGYHDGRDAMSRAEALTIDRIKAHLGYVHGNICVIPHSENVAKGNRERFLPETVRAMLDRRRAAGACPETPESDAATYLDDVDVWDEEAMRDDETNPF